MKCPFCNNEETKVIDSRIIDSGNVVRRRRECPNCGCRFTTYERLEINVMVVKRDGRREKFDRDKIIRGMMKACEKRPISLEKIEEIATEIEDKIRKEGKKEVSSEYIGKLVMNYLRDLDAVAYVRFASVYRQFADISEFERILKEFKKQKEN